MAISRISRTFKDISLSFEPHPVSNDLKILKNEDAIRRSVRNIVQTIIALNNFEERIENVEVEVDPQPDNNTFNVTIIYDIIGQEFPTQEYTFLLEATR